MKWAKHSKIFLFVAIIMSFVGLSACQTAPPVAAPSLTITSPQAGATVPAGSVTVTVQVSNFSLVNKLGQSNVAGEGHIHYYLDVEPPTTQGQPAVTAPGTYAASANTSYTWPNVARGNHTLSAQLVNNNHAPLSTPVVARVTIQVAQAASPGVTITSPQAGAIITGNSVTVSVQPANFSIVNKLGQPNVIGEGHVHYYLDVEPPTTPGQPAVTAAGTYAATTNTSYIWSNLTSGNHTFAVQLVNNNHTPLTPPVTARVTVQVAPPAATPQVMITAPTAGANLTAGNITVSVQVSNFNLVNKLGQGNVAGEGHIHYYLDATPPTTPGQPAVTATGTYAASSNTSYTWPNVASGNHTFYVQLVNNDHTPLSPPVVASVAVNVSAMAAGSATVDLAAQNFAFDKSSITVPAGATVTINFVNRDSAPHNFAAYTDSTASTLIFRGQIINAGTITYTFTAPSVRGTYFFRCDVHTAMTGSLVVQ